MKIIVVVILLVIGPAALAEDKLDASMPVRGFCIAAPGPKSLEAFIGFIHKELAPRHVNTLILRVDYRYQYESHPELKDGQALSKEAVKTLVDVCRTNKIRLIPHINLLGHQSWAGNIGNLLRHYPEFDETPEVKMPEKYKWPNPDGLYCKSYCPLHPKVHEVVFALVDELCDAFEADAFHAGMDEVFYIGNDKCPRCSGHDKAELFAGEVRLIHDHLAQKHRKLWIWGDRLLDGKTTGLGMWEASDNDTWRAIDLSAVYFAMKGFPVVTCVYRRPKVAVSQVKDMERFRMTSTPEMKERFLGVMQTVWSDVGGFLEREYQGKASEKNSANNSWTSFQAMFDEMLKAQPEER